jgi:23S rRNA (guanosine2251-2'-O)-methyltransferase
MKKNHMFLYGKNSVTERILKNPESIHKILFQDKSKLQDIKELASANKIKTETVSQKKMNSTKRPKDHQGIIAEIDEFKYVDFDDLISLEKKIDLVFLDRVTDPHNLGSIIRILACFGNFALVIPKFKACTINDTVLHVASGGENYLQVSLVSNITNSLLKAKKEQYWVVGACLGDTAESIYNFKFKFPLGVVLGSEGGGIRYGIDKYLDSKVRIPMNGASLSLNVGVACSVFCSEITRQRGE